MKTFFKFLIIAVTLLGSFSLRAQNTVYPIQLNAVMLPPYTNCLGDYFNSGANRVQVKAILRDISRYDKSLNFSLSVKVKVGNNIVLESVTPYPIQLSNANVINDLREYVPLLFSPAADNKGVRASGNYATNGYCLPEGSYEFVFQVFDFYKKNVPLSEPFSMFCYLNQAEAPVAVYPEDGACGIGSAIGISEAGVQFQWMDPIAYGPSNKMYEFVLTEKGSGSNLVGNMFSEVSEDNSLKLPVFSDKVYNNTFRYVPATSGTFVKGKEYCWYVVAKGGNITGEKDDHYAFKNKGKSNVNCFIYGDCPEKEKIFDDSKVKKTDDKLKVVLEKVDVDNDKKNAEATWKSETGDFCKYYVYYYRKDLSDASAEKAEIKDLTSLSTVLNNLEPGYEYSCYVIGATNCDKEGEAEVLSPKSNELSFKLDQKKEDDKCDANLSAIVCENLLEELNKKDYFFGTTNGEIVTVTEVTKNTDNSFTGKGIVSCSIFKNKLGLNVTFDNILINTDRYLCKGEVKVVHDDVDNLVINLNEAAGKKQGAEKAKQQESLGTQINDLAEAKNYPNQTVIFEGKLYAVDADGNAVEVGEYLEKDKVCEPKTGLDNEDGTVLFDVEKGLNGAKYDPYIDKSPNPFQAELVKKGYEWQTSSYPIPWLSMVEGEVRWITAELSGKKEAQSNLNIEDVDFYCYAADGSAVKLEKEIYGSKIKLKVYGGKKNTALKIYARKNAEKVDGECPTNEKTFGVVNVYSMSHQTKKILLAPVLNEMTLDNLQQMQDDVNKMFAPLGKTFEFTVGTAYTSQQDPQLSTLLENGLNTNEGENHFTKETSEMKYIRKHYLSYASDVSGYDACLFLLPKAAKDGLQGYMPLLGSVGYIFVGETPILNANTITHELCHGLYDIQHVFDYNGVSEGALPENIMDYPKTQSKATNRYLTKYFQWVDAEVERNLHLSFLDDPEDAEGPAIIQTGIEMIVDKFNEGFSFTTDDFVKIADAVVEFAPEQVQLVYNTYSEIGKVLDCGTSGQSIEYCLCTEANDLVGDMIETIVNNPVETKMEQYCENMKKLGLGRSCEMLKEITGQLTGNIAEQASDAVKKQIKDEFCDKYAKKRDISGVNLEKVEEKKVDDGICVKYKVEAVSGKKVSLNKISGNITSTTTSLKDFDFSDPGTLKTQIEDFEMGKNTAIKIKEGDNGMEKLGWFWNEIKKSMDINNTDYQENNNFWYSEIVLVNLCCSNNNLSPSVDLVFKFNDSNIKDGPDDNGNYVEGQKTLHLTNNSCKRDNIVKKDCDYKLSESQKNDSKLNLPKNAYLKKINDDRVDLYVDNKVDKRYNVTITDKKNCLTKIEKCKIPFGEDIKAKFNLPKGNTTTIVEEAGKYYVKFETKCCNYKFKADVKDCDLVKVYLNVPDYTVTKDNLVYFENELKKFDEISWPNYYIDCEYVFVNGVPYTYNDYFTAELIQKYFAQIVTHWISKYTVNTMQETYKKFCQNQKDITSQFAYTFENEWEQVVKGTSDVTVSYNGILKCYGDGLNWDQIQVNVINSLKSYVSDKVCNERVSFKCVLGQLIKEISKQLLNQNYVSEWFKVDEVISNNGNNYQVDPSLFKNKLSEFLINLYTNSYRLYNSTKNSNTRIKNNNTWSIIMHNENFKGVFTDSQHPYSMPKMLLNATTCCD